jgi:O-acetylserine/cysteine efflux transporter
LTAPFSAILAAIFYRERMGRWQLLGMAVAFVGVYVLAGDPTAAPSIPHLLLVVAAALAWAVANILIKRLRGINVFVLNAWVALLALPQLLLASLLLEHGQLAALAAADWRGWGAILYMALAASITAYGIWYYLLGKYEVNRIVPMTLLSPVLAVFFAVLILDETLSVRIVGGGLLTIAGVAMIQFLRPAARVPVVQP